MITNEEIINVVNCLKKGMSAGIDGIPNEMLKTSLPYLVEHFRHIFNKVLTVGVFPKPWNINTLTPLHKKGSIFTRENYRGIALSCSIA